MDILEYLKKRQSELEYKGHPMSEKDEGFKYLYCYGLGVMAVGNLRAVTELQACYDKILGSICISQKNRNQIIIDINNYFDFRIAEFFKRINSKEMQYCFKAVEQYAEDVGLEIPAIDRVAQVFGCSPDSLEKFLFLLGACRH